MLDLPHVIALKEEQYHRQGRVAMLPLGEEIALAADIGSPIRT